MFWYLRESKARIKQLFVGTKTKLKLLKSFDSLSTKLMTMVNQETSYCFLFLIKYTHVIHICHYMSIHTWLWKNHIGTYYKRFSVHLWDCLEAANTTQIMDIEYKRVNNSLHCPKRPELHRNLSSPALVAIYRYDKYKG